MKAIFRATLLFLFCSSFFALLARGQADATDLSRRDTFASMLRFTGKVMLENSVPLAEPIRVELRCNDRFIQQVITAPDGSFSLGMGGGASFEGADASVSGAEAGGFTGARNSGDRAGIRTVGLGQVDLRGCEVRAEVISGFTSTPIALEVRSVLDNPDVGTIVLQRTESSLGTSVSLNSLNAPTRARKLYARARQDLQKGKPNLERAAKRLQEALDLYPEYAAALNLLGEIHNHQGELEAARDYFARSIEQDPQYLAPNRQLLEIEIAGERWEEAAGLAAGLRELDPSSAKNPYYLGLANYQLSRFEEAGEAFQVLYEMKAEAEFPMAIFLLGMIESSRQELQSAAGRFRRFLELAPNAPPDLKNFVQARLGEWEEQGIRP